MQDTVSADRVTHSDLANAVRVLAMDAVETAKSGHPGLPMGAADIATVLFTKFLKYDAADPTWPDRDRFILSAGHGSMLLYALLHLTGVKGMTVDELKNFRKLDSKTPGHPENFMTPGVETTTGPLGQGIATAVGFALAERMAVPGSPEPAFSTASIASARATSPAFLARSVHSRAGTGSVLKCSISGI